MTRRDWHAGIDNAIAGVKFALADEGMPDDQRGEAQAVLEALAEMEM